MLTYDREFYIDIDAELRPLLVRHWNEIALDKAAVPLDVDEARYRILDEGGNLVIITARDGVRLVGYVVAILSSHLHYASTLFGAIDVFWLDPAYRAGVNGIRLFTELELELKRRGVRKMIGQTKLGAGRDVSRLFEYLGWKPIETVFSKVVT